MARFLNGWVKLHRRVLRHDVFDDLLVLGVFAKLLLMANRETSQALLNGKAIEVQPGQILTGLHNLAAKTLKTTVERKLKILEKIGTIEQQVTKSGRLITIRNWSEYQESEEETGNQRETDEKPAGNQRETGGNIMEKGRSKEEKNIYVELFNFWNANCGQLPKVSKLTAGRKSKIKARLTENPDLQYWQSAIKRMASSSFCSSGTWANIDWLISNDTNHVKVMEGKYDGRGPVSTKSVFDIVREKEALKNSARAL